MYPHYLSKTRSSPPLISPRISTRYSSKLSSYTFVTLLVLARVVIESHRHSSLPTTVTLTCRLTIYPIITSTTPMSPHIWYYAKFLIPVLSSPVIRDSRDIKSHQLHILLLLSLQPFRIFLLLSFGLCRLLVGP
jgi:hypothetical protein